MDIKEIRSLIADDMDAVDALIRKRLASEVVLINQLSHYIINSGGKRLRPAVLLLAAGATGYSGEWHRQLAAVIEFIHTATLLHDDVVDASDLRRGRDTANSIWGNEASVLVGDFLYSRSFELMVEVGNLRILDILAHATNTIAEGEVMQLLNVHEPDTTEENYLEVIRCKTAKLFEAACEIGAVLAVTDEPVTAAMRAYGRHLGIAFQLVDDALDYSANSEEIGKNVGDDLAEGKPTLPLIFAMREGNGADRQLVREAIEKGGLERILEVLAVIEKTGAIAYTARRAREEAEAAKSALQAVPASPFRNALVGLADFAVERTY